MRTQPIIGAKAWFGPKRLGWGWGPIAWEGWLAGVAYLAIVFGYPVVVDRGHRDLVTLAATAALILLCVVKGTSPGGPARAGELRRARSERQH